MRNGLNIAIQNTQTIRYISIYISHFDWSFLGMTINRARYLKEFHVQPAPDRMFQTPSQPDHRPCFELEHTEIRMNRGEARKSACSVAWSGAFSSLVCHMFASLHGARSCGEKFERKSSEKSSSTPATVFIQRPVCVEDKKFLLQHGLRALCVCESNLSSFWWIMKKML